MTIKPDNVLQFQTPQMTAAEHARIHDYYFGGCGPNSEIWPKRHSWGAWQPRALPSGMIGRERMCKTCGRWSDMKYSEAEPSDG